MDNQAVYVRFYNSADIFTNDGIGKSRRLCEDVNM